MYAARWVKAAVLYFFIGVTLGLYMEYTGVHPNPLSGFHAHVNLLGWASMAIMGGVYRAFPALEKSKLAAAQFWLYQIFTPIMLLGLFLILGMDMPQIGGPMMLVAAHAVVLSVLLFALAVWGSVKGASASREMDQAS